MIAASIVTDYDSAWLSRQTHMVSVKRDQLSRTQPNQGER
jgi:hypothetical protein